MYQLKIQLKTQESLAMIWFLSGVVVKLFSWCFTSKLTQVFMHNLVCE